MAEMWFTRTLTGCAPADADCEAALKRYPLGSTFPMDIATRKTRSSKWNARYHVLCTLIAHHVERIEVEPGGFMEIHGKDDVHTAFKYMVGLYDSIVTRGGIIRIVKSTAFDEMNADEFAEYWRKVMDVVHQKILPGVDSGTIENEIATLAA